MATVTITGNTIRGATTSKDNRTWQARAVAYQYGGIGGGVITPGADWEILYPVDGVLTFAAESGAVVDIKTPDGIPYRVRIPTGDAGLWDVIEAGVAYQPDVAQDNLNLAVANAAPGFIAAELGLQTADAIDADLAARDIGFVDLGDGEGYFTLGGVPISGTLVPPGALWSSLAGKPEVFYFETYGACDGTTNDAAAFTTVLSALSSAGGGTLVMPPKVIAMTVASTVGFVIPENVRIVGVPGKTEILITSSSDSSDYIFAASGGDNVVIDGVIFTRNSDCKMVFFTPGANTSGFHLIRCVLDGKTDTYATNYVHGVGLDSTGTKSDILLDKCTVKRLRFGLFQANATTYTVDGITVRDCLFTENIRSDLELNAPNSTMSNVLVTGCRFVDNLVDITGAGGWGVGFAHVANGVVRDCTFENYRYHAVHVEDYSTNIVVSGNTMVSCGTDYIASGVNVVTGCSRVVISDNVIDASANSASVRAILVFAGGTGTTPGGRPENAPPDNVVIVNNIINCGDSTNGMYLENCPSLTVQGNQIFGTGAVAAGAWSSGFATGYGLYVHGGSNVTIDGNTITGFQYGLRGGLGVVLALGESGVVKGNTLSDCDFGILAVPAGALNINGNIMSNCVRPMIVGEVGSGVAEPCTATGNFATGCVYPMDVGPKMGFKKSGAGTNAVGTGRTVGIINNYRKVPVGTVIVFDGGGTLTVTTAVTAVSTGEVFITGDVTDATLVAGDFGISTNLVHSTTGANDHILTANNADTVAGVYE